MPYDSLDALPGIRIRPYRVLRQFVDKSVASLNASIDLRVVRLTAAKLHLGHLPDEMCAHDAERVADHLYEECK